MTMGGISEAGMSCCTGRFAVERWKEETEGLVLKGGDGMPGTGVVERTPSIGVTFPENDSLGSATVGDCSGDCMETCLLFEVVSVIRGGRRGVVARPSSRSVLLLFAFSILSGVVGISSSRSSKMLFVGVGGDWTSKDRSNPCLIEFDIEDDRLDVVRDLAFSR